MELKQAMQERRSIRGFKKDPVPRALLEESSHWPIARHPR